MTIVKYSVDCFSVDEMEQLIGPRDEWQGWARDASDDLLAGRKPWVRIAVLKPLGWTPPWRKPGESASMTFSVIW